MAGSTALRRCAFVGAASSSTAVHARRPSTFGVGTDSTTWSEVCWSSWCCACCASSVQDHQARIDGVAEPATAPVETMQVLVLPQWRGLEELLLVPPTTADLHLRGLSVLGVRRRGVRVLVGGHER